MTKIEFWNTLTDSKSSGMVESLFTYEHIQSMRPHIQETVNNLLHTMIAEGGSTPVDLVEKFALPVPSYVRLFNLSSNSYNGY
jgi:cytochrome P450